MERYRDIATNAPDYEPLPFYSSDAELDGELDLAAWLADTSAGGASVEASEVQAVFATPTVDSVFQAVIDAPAVAEAEVEAPSGDAADTPGAGESFDEPEADTGS
jgi:hypothetical protein